MHLYQHVGFYKVPYSEKVWWKKSLANLLFLSIWQKLCQIIRSAKRLLIVSTNLVGSSLVNHEWFAEFAKLSHCTLQHSNDQLITHCLVHDYNKNLMCAICVPFVCVPFVWELLQAVTSDRNASILCYVYMCVNFCELKLYKTLQSIARRCNCYVFVND